MKIWLLKVFGICLFVSIGISLFTTYSNGQFSFYDPSGITIYDNPSLEEQQLPEILSHSDSYLPYGGYIVSPPFGYGNSQPFNFGWNQPYNYGWNQPYGFGSNYASYSLDSYYNSSSYTERYALSMNQTQPSIIPYGAFWQNQETYYLPYNSLGSHSWQIQLQDYTPYRPEYKKTDLTIYENMNRGSNMFNPYSLNTTNPYIVSGSLEWYPSGLFQSAFFPTFMIYVPRKPDHESAPSPENLFPDDMELPKQLTFSERDFRPFWSPDGKHIAFLSLRNTFNPNSSAMQFELWAMEKDGTNQRPILSVDDLDEGSRSLHSEVSWAKNSNELLVSVHNYNSSEIWSVGLDGNISTFPSIYNWAGYPLYSFDGAKIAFIVQVTEGVQGPADKLYIANSDFVQVTEGVQGPVGKLYIANSDYSEHIFIDEIMPFCYFPWQSPWQSDSQGLIYSKNNDLWEYSISENKKTQFSETPEDEENPSCSSDGKYIAFESQDAIYITPAHMFQPKKLIEEARLPQWVPNRELLVISSEQTLNNESFWTESWIIDLEGNIIKKIAQGTSSELDFAPDGEHFVYSLNRNLWLDRIGIP